MQHSFLQLNDKFSSEIYFVNVSHILYFTQCKNALNEVIGSTICLVGEETYNVKEFVEEIVMMLQKLDK